MKVELEISAKYDALGKVAQTIRGLHVSEAGQLRYESVFCLHCCLLFSFVNALKKGSQNIV